MKNGSAIADDLGRYIKQVREKRGLSQVQLAERLSVTKSLVSHIESGRRASDEVLRKLFAELDLTLKEREDLQRKCAAVGVSLGMAEGAELSLLNSVYLEFEDQQQFREIYVVAERPIELSDISERNPFLMSLAADFSGPPRRLQRQRKSPKFGRVYTYFTRESSLPEFRLFFSFLLKHTVTRAVLRNSFRVVATPEELGLLPFAIYADPVLTESHHQYDVAGRILLRDRDDVSSFRVVRMADLEVTRIYQFLRRTLQALAITPAAKPAYTLWSVEDLLR